MLEPVVPSPEAEMDTMVCCGSCVSPLNLVGALIVRELVLMI